MEVLCAVGLSGVVARALFVGAALGVLVVVAGLVVVAAALSGSVTECDDEGAE